jgi:hypothetical protein
MGAGLYAEGGETMARIDGKLSSTLCEDSLAMRLGLHTGSAYLGLGMDSSEDGASFLGCLEAGENRERGPWLIAGPGSSSGSLRFLADPTSTTAFSSGPPVALDPGLDARTAVLGLRAGPLALFGIGEGRGPLAFASRGDAEGHSMGAAAGGFSLCMLDSGYRLEALAAASYAKAPAPNSGWKPDPYAGAALNSGDGGMPITQAALIAERNGETSGALVALSGSYGELAGPAGALRLQAREEAGDLGLRLRAAAAEPRYRALFGEPEERLAGAAAELRLAMRRSSSLSLALGTEAEGQGLRYAPRWGESKALTLVLPLSMDSYRFLETGLEAKRSAEGERSGCSSLSMKSGKAEEGGAADVAAAVNWKRKFESLVLSLSTEAAAKESLPSLCLDLGLELFEGGKAASQVLAKGGIGFAFPCGDSGTLYLDAALPESGVPLEPRLDGRVDSAERKGFDPILRLRYKASFGSSTRRPRSRKSTLPKASSIAHRAES